jgi:hypothetical protein
MHPAFDAARNNQGKLNSGSGFGRWQVPLGGHDRVLLSRDRMI